LVPSCQDNIEKEIDARAICAVHNKNGTNREADLLTWLQRYAALQGFTKDDRSTVVHRVLEFADNNGCHLDVMSRDAVLVEFDKLHASCRNGVRRTSKDQERDLTSLASKALWSCYPNAVPIYDSYAQNALYILSRLAGITVMFHFAFPLPTGMMTLR
jgi:hypothetical protein